MYSPVLFKLVTFFFFAVVCFYFLPRDELLLLLYHRVLPSPVLPLFAAADGVASRKKKTLTLFWDSLSGTGEQFFSAHFVLSFAFVNGKKVGITAPLSSKNQIVEKISEIETKKKKYYNVDRTARKDILQRKKRKKKQ